MTATDDILRPLALTARLLMRFWPQLLLVGTLGYIARDLLLEAAVTVGLQHPLGGMVALSLVVLTKLLVVVAMFSVLLPGLPALSRLRESSAPAGVGGKRAGSGMLAVTAAALLPFFAYYAAWGFLGDTVREYSRLALEHMMPGERIQIFELLQSSGLIASIAACWLVRWAAKRMAVRSQAVGWRLLIVAADASWIFISLYAFGRWKDEFITWLGAGMLLEQAASLAITVAHAAETFVPVELRPAPLSEQAQNLFFYALLPFVWLVLAAIVYGYDLYARPEPTPPPPSRARTWQAWLRDFLAHFFGGYRSRYRPVWTCLRLLFGTGLATLLTFVVAYRAIGWAGAWLWYGTTHLMGPFEADTWQIIAALLDLVIGSPSELSGGILLDAIRIALLAGVLEHAVSSEVQRATSARTTAT